MIAQPTRGGGGPRPSPSPQTGGGASPTPAASSGASSSRGWTGGARYQTVRSNLNAIGENSQARRAGTQAMVNSIGAVRGVSTAQSASSVLSRSSWKSYSRPMKNIVLQSSGAGGQGITSVPQPSRVMSHGPVSGTSPGSTVGSGRASSPWTSSRGTPMRPIGGSPGYQPNPRYNRPVYDFVAKMFNPPRPGVSSQPTPAPFAGHVAGAVNAWSGLSRQFSQDRTPGRNAPVSDFFANAFNPIR